MVRTQDKETGVREMNEMIDSNRAQEAGARAQELQAVKESVYGEVLQMMEAKISEVVDEKMERRFVSICDMLQQLQSQMNRMEETRVPRGNPILPNPSPVYPSPAMTSLSMGVNVQNGNTTRTNIPPQRQGEERVTTSLRPAFVPPSLPSCDRSRNRDDVGNKYVGETCLGKLEFPRFNGKEVYDWLFKAEQYFCIDETPANYKVGISSIHFEGSAAKWHQSVSLSDPQLAYDWNRYRWLLEERFGGIQEDPMEALVNLKETNGIEAFHEQFEDRRNRVTLPEEYLVSVYLAGLRLETSLHVKMFMPKSIRDCFVIGRLFEQTKASKNVVSSGSKTTRDYTMGKGVVTKTKTANTRERLSTEELNRRRAEGQCFFCDEKFSPEHYRMKHKNTQLFSMVLDEGDENLYEELYVMLSTDDEIAEISVNAMTGMTGYSTMRVKGMRGQQELYILIDSGSTHNFVDSKVVKRMGCKVHGAADCRVKVADGRVVRVSGRIKGFQWKMNEELFKADMMVINLEGCDMVLGCQWLEKLETIAWNFRKLRMTFTLDNRLITLKGLEHNSLKVMKASRLGKAVDNHMQLSMICVQENVKESDGVKGSILQLSGKEMNHTELKKLMNRFTRLFQEPTNLPPSRALHDHKITLLQGSNPVNLRPYRYSLHQKNEIDKIVQEMLTKGLIQRSCSSFASPVVLVKKKDGTWRLCTDYRGLNTLTVKNRFPIPLIEDLMDELHGSVVFSKIDLRAGYHQVRMAEEDIHKTAFRTHGGHYEYVVMPFGLTNAPATFQGLMNSIFQPLLRRFVLVFFDDILVYSGSVEEHLIHLQQVFEIMECHQLYAKASKCEFGVSRVEYLGHIIDAEGVSTDPNKVRAVKEWPVPKSLKQLRGFLGLAGYYRRFVKNFGSIAQPLTALTKKDCFVWDKTAAEAFERLKRSLCEAPVLALPCFDKTFVVETDASGEGIGAVLMQDHHPIAYISRVLKGKHLQLSIYEKELLAVVFAIQKWRHYLLNTRFIIKTDQKSLQYILGQRLNTPLQQQWLSKLVEFDYEIQYRKGKENLAADALSRVKGEEVLHMALSVLECDLLKEIQEAYSKDAYTVDLINQLTAKPNAKPPFTWSQGILRRRGKIVVPMVSELRKRILEWLHSSSASGHSGMEVTRQRVKGLFFWKGLIKDIQSFIRSCDVCQTCKYDCSAYPGLLQPLNIPESIWSELSMDFIEGLPMSEGKSVIFVVVDRLSKAAHFMALAHPYTALSVAQVFLDHVFKLHGMPQSIVSDRDAVFLSDFWKELFKLQGVKLKYSTAYHPQSDGQTEVVNRCLETYLRCMCSETPRLWKKWLSLAEFWYNSSFHSAIQMSPFEAVYGRLPPVHLPYLPGESKIASVAKSMQERENMILLLKFYLLRAQNRMKQQADSHRTERELKVGDLVYLKLQPYRQSSMLQRTNQKLSPRYYGPYKILERCGMVAYKLELPKESKIHSVFHVSQLKLSMGTNQVRHELPVMLSEGVEKEPEKVLDRRLVQHKGKPAAMVLIKWTNLPESEATWELLPQITERFPSFKP